MRSEGSRDVSGIWGMYGVDARLRCGVRVGIRCASLLAAFAVHDRHVVGLLYTDPFCSWQMLQLDFLRNQRSWEAERARAAPEMVDANEVDIDMEAEAQKEDPQSTHMQPSQHSWEERHQQPSPHTQPQPDQHAYSSRHPNSNPELNTDEEIDAILRAEAQELEELVALHERQQQTQQHDFDHHRESVHEQELGANASSPLYGSENEDEFEEALVGLVDAAGDGGDAMDMS